VALDSKEAVKKIASSSQESPVQRPRNTELVVDQHAAQWFVRTVTWATAVYAIGVGITILLGGTARFAGLSYQVALNTPGAPSSWGISIALVGLLMLVGSLTKRVRITAFAAMVGCIWALLFTWAFLVAAVTHDSTNTTAPWAYTLLSVVFGLIAGVHQAMRPFFGRRRD
jgi:hypothetical protein